MKTSKSSVETNNPNRFESVNLAFDYGTNSKTIPAESTELNTLSQLSLNNNDKEVEGNASNVVPLSNIAEAEEQIKKIPYPKSIFFVISTVIGTSFAFFGMQSILVLYLSRQLGYSNDDATIIFHIFAMSAYFLCIMGAIIAESWLGRFKTISYFLIVFVTGLALISLGAMPPLNLPATSFTLIGLLLCAMGVGGAQPCITAFGGDQFKMPEQESKITSFFSLYYFSTNAAALLGYAITPIFREDVHCFDEKECYSLAFGVPTLVLCASTIILILTRTFYKITPSSGNMVVLVSKTIGSAISNKWKERKTHPREHWLDYADKKYEYQLIEDIKVLMRVLVLYLPLPFFWALFYQQGSRWTLQATRMNGDMGSWDIKPEQMQLLNPLLVLLFIPLCEFVIYPPLNLVGFRRPLQKLSLGGIFAGMAFIISGLLELNMEQTYPTLPSVGMAQLRVYNGELCDYSITTNLDGLYFDINSLDNYVNKSINIDTSNGLSVQLAFNVKEGDSCAAFPNQSCFLKSGKSFYMFLNSKNTTHPIVCAEDTIAKPNRGFPLGRTLANVNPSRKIQWKNGKGLIEHTEQAYQRNLTELKADTYQILIDDVQVETVKLEVGGIYTILIAEESPSKYRSKVVIVTEPNSVSILWLIPQYVVMTLGEVMFSVTGFEFSYSQAPDTMKSVLQAVWLLTIAFGNLIVVIVAELPIFDSQASEFFLFSGLMFADMIIFMFVAYYYKPNNPVAKSETAALTPVEKSVQGFDNVASTIDE